MEPWMNVTITIICSVLASSGLWAFFQKCLDKRTDKNEGHRAESAMLRGLAHDRITYLGMQYIERGWITQDEYENLDVYLFKPYEGLGGNGSAAKIMAEVRKLPLKNNDYRKAVSNDFE